jgi:antitoxin component YwqK of YwqJK toxin-antitoxin module
MSRKIETKFLNNTIMEDCEQTILDAETTIYTRDGQFVAKRVKNAQGETWYNAENKLHRDGQPAKIRLHQNGQIIQEYWYCNGTLYRQDDLPTKVLYVYGKKVNESWYCCDKQHRTGKPADIWYKDDEITREQWYHYGQLHRDDDLPAKITYKNGQKTNECWYRNDQLHRDDGPAMIWYENGQEVVKHWYRNDEFGGNVLAYTWLANVNNFRYRFVSGEHLMIDEFRDAAKSPLALELMRPLPIPIRDAIYEHYCYQ